MANFKNYANLQVLGSIYSGTSTIDASAVAQLDSTDKGFLAPRMTTAQRDLIGTPATGLFIYNTSTNKFNYYNGTVWVVIDTTAPAGADTNVQFNDGGVFGAEADFTYDKTTNLLNVNGTIQGNTLATDNYSLPSADGSANQALVTDGAGAVTFQTVMLGSKYTASITGLTGTIAAATHLRGTHPIVQITEAGEVIDAQIAINHATGEVVWTVNVALAAGEIAII